MINQLLTDKDFALMMKAHCDEIIEYLFEKEIHFSVLTNTKFISFDPILPEHITKTFGSITMFTLAGYSFESATLDEDNLYFEAGFGAENIGSYVTIPLYSIIQIVIAEKPIFINLSNYSFSDKKEEGIGVQKSMEALLSNPENQKLLKKKKR